ncbi:uncharacterized protein [Dysidea avara]|uniref:uncharacterized protein isoform X2 n=1 Tax=Dysidea avara TaxID=196820 RepID=UPI00332D5025
MEMTDNESRTTDDLNTADCPNGNTTHQKKKMAGLLKCLPKDNLTVSCTLVIVLMILGIIILQIPTILYYTAPPSTADSPLLSNIDFGTCTLSNVEVFQSAAPSVSLLEICITLGHCNDCINNTSPVFHLLQPVYDLSLFTANSPCSETVVSLFCNAINDDDIVNISLDTECMQVRDSSCASEWRLVETFFNLSLLNCSSLNDAESISLSRAPILPCPDGYGVLCGSICQPLCAEVSSFTEAATTVYRVLNIIFHSIAIISGIATLFACIYHRKKMFNHPLIFVVYYTIIFQIISYFVVAPYIIGTDSLLCSHPSLVVASANPTAFCKIQGAVIHTGGLIFLGFWLCHLCHLFFSLAFPFRAQQLMKSDCIWRFSHLTEDFRQLAMFQILLCCFIPSHYHMPSHQHLVCVYYWHLCGSCIRIIILQVG